jgi:hypothetical protein
MLAIVLACPYWISKRDILGAEQATCATRECIRNRILQPYHATHVKHRNNDILLPQINSYSRQTYSRHTRVTALAEGEPQHSHSHLSYQVVHTSQPRLVRGSMIHDEFEETSPRQPSTKTAARTASLGLGQFTRSVQDL